MKIIKYNLLNLHLTKILIQNFSLSSYGNHSKKTKIKSIGLFEGIQFSKNVFLTLRKCVPTLEDIKMKFLSSEYIEGY